MSDEQHTDDDVPEGYSKHHVAFCANDGTEEAKRCMRAALTDYIKVPVMVGSKTPDLYLTRDQCPNGCCIVMSAEDKANEQEYHFGSMPVIVAAMTNEADDEHMQAAARALTSTLN